MGVEERLQPAMQLKPEVASLNMGSMNFGLYPMLSRYKNWQHPWEEPYLAASDDRIFKNTFKDIQYILESCRANQTRFEIECYDLGHLYTAAHFLERQLLEPPLFIQSVFGILGGIATAGQAGAVFSAIVPKWFIAKRGTAMGYATMGSGVAALAIPPIVTVPVKEVTV